MRALFADDGFERDPGFREEIRRAALLSLRTVGALEMAVPVLMLPARISVIPVPVTDLRSAMPNVLFAALGALTLLASYVPQLRRGARPLTALSIAISVGIMIWASLVFAAELPWIEHHLIGYVTLVLFGSAAAVPLRPVHTLILGLSIDLALFIAAAHFSWPEHVITFAITVLCTSLTARIYRTRYTGYRMHQQALRTSEQLRETENRLLITENAAVMGRVAAALSHELNSPIGVLASAVDTLSHLVQRLPGASPSEQERLGAVALELARSGRESAQRLRAIVTRMQRFTNLDRADIQSASINDLLQDVLALVSSVPGVSATIETEFGDIPRLICYPQQLSAVFSNLLSNALEAVPAEGGRVRVATTPSPGGIDVTIEDNGYGIPAEQLATLFDPAAFHVSGSRVTAGNWSLFSCRQIVREHGGEIAVSSEPGRGTSVSVKLPLQRASAAV